MWAGSRPGWIEMTCDCCGTRLGWGGTSFEGHDLYCDYCADTCFAGYEQQRGPEIPMLSLLRNLPEMKEGDKIYFPRYAPIYGRDL